MGSKKIFKTSNKIALIIFILVVMGALAFRMSLDTAIEAFDIGNTTKILVEIPMGSSTSDIANILEENKIIGNASAFALVSKITGNDGKYKAATYAISPSMNAYDIMEILKSGVSVGNMITIPEGYTIKQVADVLEKAKLIDRVVFLDETENGKFNQEFVSFLPDGPNRLEGFLFPETYDIPLNATEHDIINIMLDQFDTIFTNTYYSKAKEMGYDINDIITVASMIEREAATNEDRPIVSSVVYNRLKQEMPLQFCSTIQYVLGDPKARLSYEDTQIESDYNTYINAGLPKGPICSPGIESIKAALYPEDTEYLYFVVDPDGKKTHKFAKTYEEFLQYKKDYTDSL